jgi:hypothetical protein
MSRLQIGLISALLVGWLLLPAEAAELRDYTVADLLKPCEEGDNDARWGADLEVTCEQFINGFTGAYLLFTEGGQAQGVCLPPPGNRSDEIRWACMKWAYENYHRRQMPAAEGLLAAIKAHFSCG